MKSLKGNTIRFMNLKSAIIFLTQFVILFSFINAQKEEISSSKINNDNQNTNPNNNLIIPQKEIYSNIKFLDDENNENF